MSRDPMRWHVRTDPVCILYREPRTWWGRRRHDRARGRGCLRCLRSYGLNDADVANVNRRWVRER